MREILQRLLDQPPPVRIFATVTAVSAGGYTVTDNQGRQILVDGDLGYLPGAEVIIQGGRIVGRGSRPPIKTTYKV